MDFNSAPLPFAYNVQPITSLAPQDPLQLAGQVPFNLNQFSNPYTQITCSQLSQLPSAPVVVDNTPTWAGALNLSTHLDLPVDCVCPICPASDLIR